MSAKAKEQIKQDRFTSQADLLDALRARYPRDSYALFRNIRNATGFQRGARYADALVMSLWPSRGLELIGFEIKISRQDWLKELNQPEKAEEFYRYCDKWWLLVSDTAIVHPGELPSTWGLLAPRGRRLAAKVEAPQLNPQPLSKEFLASLLRTIEKEQTSEVDIERHYQRGYDEGYRHSKEALEKRYTARLADEQRRYDTLHKKIEQFEQASGIKIDYYHDTSALGAAVATLLRGDHTQHRAALVHMLTQVQHIASQLERSIQHLNLPIESQK